MDNYTAANIIVDIMEMKASLMKPRSLGQEQDLEELFKYSMFEAIIAKLSDRYKIKYSDIEPILRKRAEQSRYGHSTDHCHLEFVDGEKACTYVHKIGEECLMDYSNA